MGLFIEDPTCYCQQTAGGDTFMSKISEFLRKNSIGTEPSRLPYVHSTMSYNLEKIIEENHLSLSECKHFKEELLYFFRGRPAYRQSSDGEEASYWQLPTCFVYDRLPRAKVERTFPFDSGAFKSGRYPEYIRFMPIEEFVVEGSDASDRMIEAFFGDIMSYVSGKAKPENELSDTYDISAFDAEVLAIRRLASDGTPRTFDDRRFTIELQLSTPINLSTNSPSAVIMPLIYLDDPKVRAAITAWGARPITYDVHAQSLEVYYGVIFQKFLDYLRERNIVS